MAEAHLFEGLDGYPRSVKPRSAGRTMVVDWGLGPNAQEDLCVLAAPYFDFAKVATGMSRLYSNDQLTSKVAYYKTHGVEPFPGGQYLEYAETIGKADRYLPAVTAAGYNWVEVSDNILPDGLAWKSKYIRLAIEQFGLNVLGEVGKKEGLAHGPAFVDDARACLDAGAEIILLEAAELVDDNPETAREVEATVAAVGVDSVMFELPGPWIEGVNLFDVHRMRKQLIDRFGREVNVGNVAPDDLFGLEAYRRVLGVNAGSVWEE